MILLIDNYDSFSYNLYQLIGEIDQHIKVVRNDEMTIEEIKKLKPDRIILSPGPGRPEDAGIIIEIIKKLGKNISPKQLLVISDIAFTLDDVITIGTDLDEMESFFKFVSIG